MQEPLPPAQSVIPRRDKRSLILIAPFEDKNHPFHPQQSKMQQ